MAISRYRGNKQYREVHPKIFIWSHAEKAELKYFKEFKNHLKTPLIVIRQEKTWTPQEFLEKIVAWRAKEINSEDGDKVWCIFDIDDFCKNQREKEALLGLIKDAKKNGINIAYSNECFELWILLHFERTVSPVCRGKEIEKKIQKYFKQHGLGDFNKNQQVFHILLPFQEQAIKNAKVSIANYKDIDWDNALSDNGNPSTSIHFLVEEINKLIRR